MRFFQQRHYRKSDRPIGFTLVELLVAMTVTLLLMAALARVFGSIGKSIQDGRAEVNLSSKLRGLSYRLRSDLSAMTARVDPPLSPGSSQGYFMYYEGPLTESTYAMYGAEPIRTFPDGREVGLGEQPVPNGQTFNFAFPANVGEAVTYRRHSRIGDIDDYIAFTAEAQGDNWFTGKVPRYMVDSGPFPQSGSRDRGIFEDTNDNAVFDAAETIDEAAAMTPTTIRSKFAEVIIWASPRWAVNENFREVALADDTGMPLFADADNDLVPDDVVLHQRILLIRPDLNDFATLSSNQGYDGIQTSFEADTMKTLPVRRTNPNVAEAPQPANIPTALERVYPISHSNGAIYDQYVDGGTIGAGADSSEFLGREQDPASGSWVPTDDNDRSGCGWLLGMAPIHHFFDLSIRRIFHPRTGDPTPFVACNSLSDLTQPHNRFGHVRIPGRYLERPQNATGGPEADHATSMPLLATASHGLPMRWLGNNDPRIETTLNYANFNDNGVPNWFPRNAYQRNASNRTTLPLGLFTGWLLPHFELGNANPDPRAFNNNLPAGGTPVPDDLGWYRRYLPSYDARWDRTGEDVMASNVMSFDVRGFDASAPVFATAGNDGRAGVAGVDDDGIGGIDQIVISPPSTELGAVGSDDQMVTVSDTGVYALIRRDLFNPSDLPSAVPDADEPVSTQGVVARGDFVDLHYPYLAGSPFLNSHLQFSTSTGFAAQIASLFSSDLSGFTNRNSRPINGIQSVRGDSLKGSGKMLFLEDGNYVYFQPTYDTWTNSYESDGFDQTSTRSGTQPNPNPHRGTVWVMKDAPPNSIGSTNRIRAGGIPENFQDDSGRFYDGQPEVPPPYPAAIPAISATIRLQDRATEQVTEFTVIQDLN